jgi:hypothetical protein
VLNTSFELKDASGQWEPGCGIQCNPPKRSRMILTTHHTFFLVG